MNNIIDLEERKLKKKNEDALSCFKGERFYFVAKIHSNTGQDLHWVPDGGYKTPYNTVYHTIDAIIKASVEGHIVGWQTAFFMNKDRDADDLTQYRIYCIGLMFKEPIEQAIRLCNVEFDYTCVGDYFIHDVIDNFRNQILEQK
jgi:hypothetical protein